METRRSCAVSLAPAALGSCWVEDRDVISLCLQTSANATPVSLDQGLSEWIGPAHGNENTAQGWQTCRFEFAKSAGWDRAKAHQWAEQHLHFHDTGRTI